MNKEEWMKNSKDVLHELYDTIKGNNLHINWSVRKRRQREKGRESLFK